MTKIQYKVGDATNPQDKDNNKVIAHICNNLGAWGAGFVLALSKKWSKPEESYRKMTSRTLGECDFILVDNDIIICNMIAQDEVISQTKAQGKKSPIRYDALVDCLISLNQFCINSQSSLHLPRIGSGLAGGNWTAISALIEEHITVPTYVYDLKPENGINYI